MLECPHLAHAVVQSGVCYRCDGVTLDLSVSSNMIASVSENENKVSCILPPPHHLCTHNCLQQSIKECFRIVIVCGDSQTTNSLLQTWRKQVCFFRLHTCILRNIGIDIYQNTRLKKTWMSWTKLRHLVPSHTGSDKKCKLRKKAASTGIGQYLYHVPFIVPHVVCNTLTVNALVSLVRDITWR